MSNNDFSFFRAPGKTTIPESSKTLSEIYLLIKGDEYKERTEALRRSEGGEYRTIKTERFDFVIFGGVFDYRHLDPAGKQREIKEEIKRQADSRKISVLENLVKMLDGKQGLLSSSGFIVLDLDHLSQAGLDLKGVRDSLLKDKDLGLRLLFVSPGGDGLKLVCESLWGTDTPEIYKSEYYSLCGYLHEVHNIPYYIQVPGGKPVQILDNTPDITRTCFLPYDPEAVLNLDSSPFNSDDFPYTEEDVKEDSYRESGKGIPPERWRISLEVGNSSDWKTFKERRLIPAIFERVDELFPDMDFRFYGSKWMSPYKLDGTSPKTPRRDKTVITSRVPERVLEQGESPLGIIDFYMQKNSLSFSDSVKVLSERCGLAAEERELRIKTAQSLNKDNIDPFTMKDKETLPKEEESPSGAWIEEYTKVPDLSLLAKKKREGVRTGYYFEGNGKKEELLLNTGLTFVGGKTSHGKSTFIRNLALRISRGLPDGESVLYLTFEESLEDVCFQFANLYVNEEKISDLGTKNTEVIRDYFETGTLNKCPQEKRGRIVSRLQDFSVFWNSGKLQVHYCELDSSKLCELVSGLVSLTNPKVIFIDYVQVLRKEGGRKERNQELKEICKELQDTSTKTGIPFVLTAQFNRETPNPLDMGAENIADSYDISRYADTIVCLWNTNIKDGVKDRSSFVERADYKIDLLSKGFDLDTPGKLFAKLSKNRQGTPNIFAVLDFNGETGEIRTNEKTETPKKRNLFDT